MAQGESCGVTRTIKLIKEYGASVDGINKILMKSAVLALCFVFFSFVGAVGSDDAIIAA
jgi:hypothetical protein